MKQMAAITMGLWLGVAGLAMAADKPLVLELWPGKAPDQPGTIGPGKDPQTLELAGYPKVKVFIRGWEQWSADNEAPVEGK
jgi:hypothetical protein